MVGDHGLKDLVKSLSGAEPDESPDFRDIGDSTRHILEAFLIGKLVGDVHDLRRGAGLGFDAERQFVEDLPPWRRTAKIGISRTAI